LSLEQYFGGISAPGVTKLVLMDEEIAPQNSCKEILGWTIHSCYFHYTKSVISWIQKHGLKSAMSERDFMDWINALLGTYLIKIFH